MSDSAPAQNMQAYSTQANPFTTSDKVSDLCKAKEDMRCADSTNKTRTRINYAALLCLRGDECY